MADQPFELVRQDLLPGVERLVVEEHAGLHRDVLGEAWSPPLAYRWIRYEDPDPMGRLIAATLALDERWEEASANPRAAGIRTGLARREAGRLRELTAVAASLGFQSAGQPD